MDKLHKTFYGYFLYRIKSKSAANYKSFSDTGDDVGVKSNVA